MNIKLQEQFDLLEKTRQEIITRLSTVNAAAFQSGSNNKWSLGEVLIHLITSEKLALQYMQKKSLGVSSLGNSGLIEPFKLFLLKISQRLPLKYKVPRVIREKTPVSPGKEELFALWTSQQKALAEFLSTIDDANLNKKIFKHPIAGMFNAAQGVAFLREHLLHHKPQIDRLIAQAKKPSR